MEHRIGAIIDELLYNANRAFFSLWLVNGSPHAKVSRSVLVWFRFLDGR
jgi:hypothetical protein